MSRPSTSLAAQRRGFGQRRIADRGPEVGEQVHLLAQAQKARLGADLEWHVVPLRPADRTEHHRIRSLRLVERFVGQRHAVLVDRTAPDEVALDFECDVVGFWR